MTDPDQLPLDDLDETPVEDDLVEARETIDEVAKTEGSDEPEAGGADTDHGPGDVDTPQDAVADEGSVAGDVHEEEPEKPDDSPVTWYLLTNTLNLRAWMSRRLAFGRAGFEKYYQDVPDLTGGATVLFPGAPGQELRDHATAEADDLVPALVAVADDVVKGLDPSAPVTVDGVIHEAYLGPILLPHDRDVDDFLSRSFEDVPATLSPVAAPELFEGGRWSIEDLDPAKEAADAEAYARSDRLAAGVLGLVAACRCRPAEFRTVADVLEEVMSDGFEVTPSWLHDKDERSILEKIRGVLLGHDALRSLQPLAVLDEVREELSGLPLGDETAELVEKYLDRIRSILDLEADFEPLRPGGIVPLKALLLVLIRPNLARVLDWSPDETHADTAVRLTAGYLAGTLEPRSALRLELRPEFLDKFLADREAEALGGPGELVFPSGRGAKVAVVVEDDRCAITLDDLPLYEKLLEPVPASTKLRASLASERVDDDTALYVADEMDWSDVISTIVGPVGEMTVVAEKKGKAYLRLPGRVSVATEVDREAFARRMASADLQRLDDLTLDGLTTPTPRDLEAMELEGE